MPIILKRGTESNRPSLFLRVGEPIFTTDNRRLYIGSGASDGGKELTFGQLTASYVSASIVTASAIKVDQLEATSIVGSIESASYSATASYLLGSISSASFAQTSATSSYLSSSGQNVALGDILSTDTSSGVWAGNQSVMGSGIFVQRSALAARSTLLSAGTAVNGNGSYNIAVAAGTLGAISPTLNGHFGSWQLQTYGGSTWGTSARMMIQTSGDHNEGSRPTDIIFQSTPSGSTTLQTRLKVNGSGVQVTGSLGVNGSIGINASMVMAKKYVTINTSSYSTMLTVNMGDNDSAYLKLSVHGSWQTGGAGVYVGEYFIQKDVTTGGRHPGAIISQINNNEPGEILANISAGDPAAGNQNIDIQLWASSSSAPVGDFLMLYELRGQYNTVT